MTDTFSRPAPPFGAIGRIVRSRVRLFTGIITGAAAYFLMPAHWSRHGRAIFAWDVGVLVFLGLAAALFYTAKPETMPERAERQEDGEWTIFFLTVGAVVISFVAILDEFAGVKDLPDFRRELTIIAVAVTLFLSWLMTHVTFAFRYAHEYYETDDKTGRPEGGLEFPGNEPPDYSDFLYFALVLGMTFQVSDVQITSRKLRRLAALHGLMAFMFNATIIALTVNIVSGLL